MQVYPIRIHFLNYAKLPRLVPFLDLFFATDCIFHVVMKFIPDQSFNVIILGETFKAPVFVFPNARPQAARYTRVNGATIAVRHDVSCGEFFFAHIEKISDSEFVSSKAGSPPARG